jgi:hypothetical protein
MTKSQVLGSTMLEFIGASDENQQLMLEIAQALNKRNKDANQRAPLLREALLVPLTSVTQAVKSIFSEPVSTNFTIASGISPREILKSVKGTETTDSLWVDFDIDKVFSLVGIDKVFSRDGAEVVPTQVTVTERKIIEHGLEGDMKKALSNLSSIGLIYLLATELQKVVDRQPSNLFKKEGRKLFFICDLVVGVIWNNIELGWSVYVWEKDYNYVWPNGDTVVSYN